MNQSWHRAAREPILVMRPASLAGWKGNSSPDHMSRNAQRYLHTDLFDLYALGPGLGLLRLYVCWLMFDRSARRSPTSFVGTERCAAAGWASNYAPVN